MLCAGLDEKGIRYGGGGEGEGERHDGKQAKSGGGGDRMSEKGSKEDVVET